MLLSWLISLVEKSYHGCFIPQHHLPTKCLDTGQMQESVPVPRSGVGEELGSHANSSEPETYSFTSLKPFRLFKGGPFLKVSVMDLCYWIFSSFLFSPSRATRKASMLEKQPKCSGCWNARDIIWGSLRSGKDPLGGCSSFTFIERFYHKNICFCDWNTFIITTFNKRHAYFSRLLIWFL